MALPSRNTAGLFISLSVMMFVLYFAWGAWYATMGTFMTARDLATRIGSAYSVAPIAAVLVLFWLLFREQKTTDFSAI